MKLKKKKLFKWEYVLILIICSCNVKNNKGYNLKNNLKKEYIIEYKRIDSMTKVLSKKGMLDSALFYSNRLLKLAILHKDSILISNAYFKKGLYNKKKGLLDSAYVWYRKSKDISLEINDSINIVKRLTSIAKLESDFEFYYKSDSTTYLAINYVNSRSEKYLTSLYNCLGINHKKRYDYTGAIFWYKKALKITKNETKRYRYRNNMAVCYKELKYYNKSLEIYENIINSNHYNKLPNLIKAKVFDNYLYTKWLNGGEVLESDFRMALDVKKENENYIGMNASYSHLFDFFQGKDKERSKEYGIKMLNSARLAKNKKAIKEALSKLLFLEIDKKESYLKEFIFLTNETEKSNLLSQNKSVSTIHRVNLISLEIEKAEKKVTNSELLREKAENKKQLWIFIGLTTMLGFVTYFFYKRAKTKKEKVIEVYKTETRLAKKIHDELANDVYLAMNKIQNKAGEESSILVDLEKIYLQTRNISHENSPVLTGNQFEDFLKQLFADFSADGCKVMNKGLSEITVNELSKEKQIVIYRVLQELLVNMKKYSEANLVIVSFSLIKDTLRIQYKDNGIGVETLEIKNGLQNMETRMKSIGGSITFESEMQKGFQAKFQFKK
ncbi:hypothetical protein [Tenacibaculum halocynthiae]|uniref:ATP-binding protein n=1 Tax=Tenacibaculum halocynthiae TaxID=1254437 RepID=UPI003D649825